MANYRTEDMMFESVKVAWPCLFAPKTKGMKGEEISPRYESNILVPKLAPDMASCPNAQRLLSMLHEAMVAEGHQLGVGDWPRTSNFPIVDGDAAGKEATAGHWQIIPKKFCGAAGYRPRLAFLTAQGTYEEFVAGTPGFEQTITHGDIVHVSINAYYSEAGKNAQFGLSIVIKVADGNLPGGGGDTRPLDQVFPNPAGGTPMAPPAPIAVPPAAIPTAPPVYTPPVAPTAAPPAYAPPVAPTAAPPVYAPPVAPVAPVYTPPVAPTVAPPVAAPVPLAGPPAVAPVAPPVPAPVAPTVPIASPSNPPAPPVYAAPPVAPTAAPPAAPPVAPPMGTGLPPLNQ